MPGMPRPRFEVRFRSSQSHCRLDAAPVRRRPWSRCGLRHFETHSRTRRLCHGFIWTLLSKSIPPRPESDPLRQSSLRRREKAAADSAEKPSSKDKGFRFQGMLEFLERNFEESNSDSYREWMTQYMSATTCALARRRLRPESLAVKSAAGPSRTSPRWRSPMRAPPSTKSARGLTQRQKEIAGRAARRNCRAPRFSARRRPRLPQPRPFRRHAFRRRSPAHSPGHADRLASARSALCARRAFHRSARARQRSPALIARKAARSGQHRTRRRARRRNHSPRRLRGGPRSRRRQRRRISGRHGSPEEIAAQSRFAHRPISLRRN